MRQKSKCRNLTQVLFSLAVLILSSNALADYNSWSYSGSGYGSGYSGYSGYSGNSGFYSGRTSSYPVISLDLDPQDSLNSSFRIAAREDRLNDLEKIIREGADANSQSEKGENALMYSARNCSPKVAKFLLRRGVNVNLVDEKGRTALMFASIETCVDLVKLLLAAPSIDVRIRDNAGMAALDYAKDASIMEVNGPSTEIMNLIYIARKRSSKNSIHPIQSIQSSKQRLAIKPIG